MHQACVEEAFAKQRRNLVAVSALLLFYLSSGIEITTISLVGNSASVRRPELVGLVLWLGWLYAFLRYYQYFRQIDDKGFGSEFDERLDHLVKRKAESKFRSKFEMPSDLPQEGHPYRLAIQYQDTTAERSGSSWVSRVSAKAKSPLDLMSKDLKPVFIEIKRAALVALRVRSVIHVALRTPSVTEYWLPFVFAASPVLYCFGRLLLRIATPA